MEEIKANEAREEGRSMTIHFVIKLGWRILVLLIKY
jgi:hypothetical protein